ncbi:MAG: (4Fe-4S)-binding protein [Planctomycetota bacterium]|nr:(4Fe-4S)-binding protein [Planctomycetota bacterium]
MARKVYTGTAIDVAFDLDTCIHAAECVRGLPKVFDPDRKPWILPDEASADALRDVVARCPSGALEIQEKGESPAAAAPAGIQVQTGGGGPHIVKGGCTVVGPDGGVLKEGAVVALCACGRTGNAPFCDGSHAK